MTKKYITASYIFDGKQILTNHVLVVENQTVVAVEERLASHQLVDLGNVVISRGLIDLQINGCGGVLFNDDISKQTLEVMYQTCLRFGTTKFLPTLITTHSDNMLTALKVVDEWMSEFGDNRGVVGLHLEGPFISSQKPGIHEVKYIRSPSDAELKQIIPYANKYPLKMTIAPEVFTSEQIKLLVNAGVILSIGHSNASYEEAQAGFAAGIVTATHAFNAMSGLSGRNPGVIGAIMNSDCYVGLIADLIHVSSPNIQLLYKLKHGQLYIVTDAVTPMGTNLSEFYLAGKKMLIDNGKCVDENGTIGGANITLTQSIKNLVTCNISLEAALGMALTVPANVLAKPHLASIMHAPVNDLVAIDLTHYSAKTVSLV